METALRGKYISVQRAAEIMGYTPQHTRLLVRQGKLAARKIGRDWLIREQDVLAFRASQTRPLLSVVAEAPRAELTGARRLPPRGPTATSLQAVNVAQVPQLSPFRYPGGKTWLVPYARQWLRSLGSPVEFLVEPFAGGAIVALTAVFEGLAKHAALVELDEDVAAVWQTILRGNWRGLVERIADFRPTREALQSLLAEPDDSRAAGFRDSGQESAGPRRHFGPGCGDCEERRERSRLGFALVSGYPLPPHRGDRGASVAFLDTMRGRAESAASLPQCRRVRLFR